LETTSRTLSHVPCPSAAAPAHPAAAAPGQQQQQQQQQQQREPAPESSSGVVNQAAIDLLRRLPGVTDANFRPLMGGLNSLAELADASLERLQELMGGAKAAQMLYDFLHAPCPAAGVLGPGAAAAAAT
jgi:hypothetical protein